MIRNESVRFKVRRNGAEYAEIYPANNSAPQLRAAVKSQIKMSLRGTFLQSAFDSRGNQVEVDWLSDEIEPVLVINQEETPLGILMVATVKQNIGTPSTVDIEAYDRSWRVKDTRKASTVYFSAGTLYLDAVEALLVESGIENIARTETTSVLTEAREDWEAGTSNLEIVNALLSEINYNELWFNQTGVAVLQPQKSAEAANIQHIFTDKKPDPRNPKEIGVIGVYPDRSKSVDVYNAPNVIICICSNADKSGPMVAMAENMNANNPLSIPRRGRRITSTIKVSNIASQEALQAYAEQKVTESIMTGEAISVKTQLQPGFGIGDVTALQTEEVTGVCIEKSWTMELRPGGTMTHELERVVYNIG